MTKITDEEKKYLASLPVRHVQDGVAEVHGAFCTPKICKKLTGYDNFPLEQRVDYLTMSLYCAEFNPSNVELCFDSLRAANCTVCFVGHTQVAEGWMQSIKKLRQPTNFSLGHFEKEYVLPLKKDFRYLFDVGAVGQPRDHDPRASYCIYTGDLLINRRVDYDCTFTMKKIIDAKLPKELAIRLAYGR